MSRLISRAEAWEKAYEAFSQINFTAFDYNTIKRSIQDYLRLYFPESFNDFIESSELVAIIEVFAYIGELLIYRVDVGSHENFMSVAQRKQSVLRLAKLISYKATRNIPARGLLKLTSVSTTEVVYDSRGTMLTGAKIRWNDLQNNLWKEQFTAILNAASSSTIGSVIPTERVQVDNVLFELYSFNNIYNTRGVLPYSVVSNGSTYAMEVVPVKLDQYGPAERRPEIGSSLTFLYGADGFGNDSPTTGFFLFTKQGRLSSQRLSFDGKTPNQFVDLDDVNINDTDIWINNIDPITGAILTNGDRSIARVGEWAEVDTTSAQNIVFSYTSGKNRFEVETLEDDRVRVVFGDGEFANIPAGTFDIWYRTSANENLIIPQNAVADQQFDIDYYDTQGQRQTLTITASLTSNVQNASMSEDVDHIRRAAPAAYYSQNRMVSATDYNLFPLKDPSILKMRAINRTFAGESKFSAWYDASETYENVKMAGEDMVLMLDDSASIVSLGTMATPQKVLLNLIVPALASNEMFLHLSTQHIREVRRYLTPTESANFLTAITKMSASTTLWIVYDVNKDVYTITSEYTPQRIMSIDRTTMGWRVTYQSVNIIAESPTTNFWSVNNGAIISADTLTAQSDTITILKANESKFCKLLSAPIQLIASNLVLDKDGLQNINKMKVKAYSSTTSLQQSVDVLHELLDPVYTISADLTVTPAIDVLTLPKVLGAPLINGKKVVLPFYYVKGINEVVLPGLVPPLLDSTGGYRFGGWSEDSTVNPGSLTNVITVFANVEYPIQLVRQSFVYQYRPDANHLFTQIPTTDDVRQAEASEVLNNIAPSVRVYGRARGVRGLNFLWMHTAPNYNLIDPSSTNINDIFVIQRGYYTNYINWLDGVVTKPIPPTPLQLRNDYKELLINSMLSDTVVFHPGKLKLVFGDKAIPELRATIMVVKNDVSSLTDSQIKLNVKRITRDFFDISFWEFGETFYFTELAAVIHRELAADINSVVLVPSSPKHYFGDLFQVNVQEDEIVQVDVDVSDIEIVSSLNASRLRQFL